MVFLWELSRKSSPTETLLCWCWFCWSHVAPRSFQLISLWTYVMASLCGGKKKEKRKKVAPLPTSQRIWASCVCFCSPCQSVKLDPYIPFPWRQVTSYTSGCTGLCQRHECSREEECWLGSATAKVFPTAGHLGEQQWTVCKGCLEI